MVTASGLIILAGTENNEQAIKDADKGVALNNSNPQAYQIRANVKKNIKDFGGALHDYNTAIRLCPFSSGLYCERGQLYYELNQPEKALSDFSEAVRLNPSNGNYLKKRAEVYIELGQLEDAKTDLNKALKRLNNDTQAWALLSRVNFDLKDWDAAIENLTEAILLDPHCALNYSNRGKAYYKKGAIKDALNDLHKAYNTMDPNNEEFFNDFGKIIGEYIQLDPELSLEFLNTIKEDKNIPKEKDAEAAFKLYPEYESRMLLIRAEVEFCNGQIDEAEEDAARILNLTHKETHLNAYQMLSLIHRVKGQSNIAESYWKKAVQLDQKFSNKGIIVIKVHKGKNAEKCGILENDKLLSYEEVPLWSLTDLQILTHREGRNKRIIKIERGGKIIEYMVPKGQLGITISQISNQPQKLQEK